ncbi:MAG: hypothetical protein ACP6IU_01985 [Candidatus Asgardarchaeia archaeon]
MSEKQNIINFLLQVIGYGATALGFTMAVSAWYGNYLNGIYLGAGVAVFGIVLLVVWYFMKGKEGGS